MKKLSEVIKSTRMWQHFWERCERDYFFTSLIKVGKKLFLNMDVLAFLYLLPEGQREKRNSWDGKTPLIFPVFLKQL